MDVREFFERAKRICNKNNEKQCSEHPDDFPEKCVARVFDLDKPTDVVLIRDTMEELQENIRNHTSKMFRPRDAEDVPALVGVWV